MRLDCRKGIEPVKSSTSICKKKYKIQASKTGNKMQFIPYFYNEHINLGPNQSIRGLLDCLET